jgi:hypothetical protein
MSSTKVRRHSIRESTELSPELKSQLRSAEYLYNSLSAGSKNRLSQYRRNLAVTRGKGHPEFDKDILKLIKPYVYSDMRLSSQLKYLSNLKDERGISFARNYKCYSDIEPQIQRFLDKPYTSFRWNVNYQTALSQLRSEFSKLNLRPLMYGNDDDILKALPKSDTHSGYVYIESGLKEKGMNMEGIYDTYKQVSEEAIKEGTFNRPIMISFRTQASGEFDSHGERTNDCKLKTRVVSMADLLFLIVELRFMKPIQDFLNTRTWYTGGKDRNHIAMEISDGRANFNNWISIDYSSFDQTLPPWLIEDVWNVFKEAFILTDDDSKLLDAVIHDTIHKDFILAEGIAHSDVGLPSGYNFTNAGGSACNRVIWLTYAIANKIKSKMIACGDDNLIFTEKPIIAEDLASYIGKNFGMVINPDKSDSGRCNKEFPTFLACEWRLDGQFRHPLILLSRLLYPERHRRYNESVRPEHVLYAYILTYRLGMEKLLDVNRFFRDYPFMNPRYVLDTVDDRYMPGAFQFMRHYIWDER